MKNLMRALRDVIIAGVIVLAGIGFMPQEVWATGTGAASFNISSLDIEKGTTDSSSIVLTYTLDGDDNDTIVMDVSGSGVTVNSPSGSISSSPVTFDITASGTAGESATIKVTVSGDGHPDIVVTCTVTVKAAPTRSISLDNPSLSLVGSGTGTLTATPINFAAADIEWVLDPSDTDKISISPTTGATTTITPLKPTSTPVAVVARDKNHPDVSATCNVSVTETVTLTATSKELLAGGSFDLTASIDPSSSETVTWSGANSYVSMTHSGNTATITGTANGTATIKATTASGASALCTVTVKPVEVIAPIPDYVLVGTASSTITPVITTGSTLTAADVEWSCSPAGTVTFSSATGATTVTGVTAGTTKITASLKSGGTVVDTYEKNITVVPKFETADAVVTASPDTLGASGQSTVTASGTTGSYNKVTWAISPATGSLSSTTTNPTTYKAPASVTSASSVTVTATYYYRSDTVGTKAVTINLEPLSAVDVADIFVTKGFSVKPTISTTPAGTYSVSKVSGFDDVSTEGSTTSDFKVKGVTVNVSGRDYTLKVGDRTDSAKIYVYDVPKLSYSDKKLSIDLPSKIYTGGSSNISNVTRGVIKVYYDGDCLWTSDKKEDYADDKEISAEKIQSIIKEDKIYDKLKNLDKDKATLQFRVYGADKNNYNEQAYGEDDVDVYRITVSGTGVNTTKYYGVKGANISLNATAATGYSNAKFKDSDSSTKSVTVDGSATYTATAEKSGASNSTGAGANGANGAGGANGANSKYDKVPKTGEAGDVWAMWVVFLACIVAAGAVFVVRIKPEILMRGKDNKK